MLNSITCDTDPSEILSMADISSYLTEMDDSCKEYKSKIQNTIIEEQTSLGLSTKAYSIDNHSSLQEKSNQLLDNILLEKQWDSLKEEINEKLTEQRTKEIDKLHQKIVEKLDDLKEQYQKVYDSIIRIKLNTNNQTDLEPLLSQKDSLEEEIKKYEQKKNTVEGMK